ncbi:hypothetical protein KIH39_21620 [Telmatocola sphagniphila]|jgi:hypothetical protein|uniref:Uncharacterized protein n=1 Tax=Telmatocola sphagniphila TaxID=1123043 RepID=A0A8E6B510_9BACT|nr:hypothetical protein [Telmatocola sphagniphila]QVL31419.1 hypothetical protein KIH39_21620 [Telmatocola sphagniphila]
MKPDGQDQVRAQEDECLDNSLAELASLNEDETAEESIEDLQCTKLVTNIRTILEPEADLD